MERLAKRLDDLPPGVTYKMVAVELINTKGRLAEIENTLLYLAEDGEKYDDIPYAILAQVARKKRREGIKDETIYAEVARCIKESVR